MKITDTIKYVGVNDHKVDLFEGQYPVANGMAYNSYVILDEKIAVMDTVDTNFTHEWLDNLEQVLDGRKPDYLIVQHMEPDHAANVANFLKVYPDTTVVANVKTFQMCLRQYKQALWRGQVNDFSLQGLQGRDMNELTIGVMGTGRIGLQVLKNLSGFGCRLLAYDVYKNPEAEKIATYVALRWAATTAWSPAPPSAA